MKKSNYKINLKHDRYIINILGEVCWGFPINDFEKKIGEKNEVVEVLLERLLKEEKMGVIETYLIASEIELIKRAFKEVEKEIEEWEFQTRIGISLKEARKINEKFS